MEKRRIRYFLSAFACVFIFMFISTSKNLQRSEQLWAEMDKIWRLEWFGNNELKQTFLKSLNETKGNGKKVKTILYWNAFFNIKHFTFGIGKAPFFGCAVTNCVVWDNEDGKPPLQVQDFDAVLFHAFYLEGDELIAPLSRSPHQRYVFYLYESPGRFKYYFTPLVNFFNWTMTYRRDSDVYSPYGFISNATIPNRAPINWVDPHYENISVVTKPNKTKPIAWLVSDCSSQAQREVYVKKLSKFIQVDIYGACGIFTCERSKNEECFEMVEDNYMFYLSFENALCKDYVTEKLFRYMVYNIVPVVYGGVDYKTHAPPMSFIDVKDYSSPEELANYLHFLIKNPEEYKKYFWWKDYYHVDFTWGKNAMCSLCEMLNDDQQPEKVYGDIQDWWANPKFCHTMNQHFDNLDFS